MRSTRARRLRVAAAWTLLSWAASGAGAAPLDALFSPAPARGLEAAAVTGGAVERESRNAAQGRSAPGAEPAGGPERKPAARPGRDGAPPPAGGPAAGPGPALRLVLLDGTAIEGRIEALRDGEFAVAGRPDPVPLYELQELELPGVEEDAPDLDSGPLLRFRSGESLAARVESSDGKTALVRLEGLGTLSFPLAALAAFRLREAYASDPLFERDLERPAPERDAIYARRGRTLLRVEGIFRGLDAETLAVEIGGRVRRMPRRLVQGVILARVAAETPEVDPPQQFELPGLGKFPGYLHGLEAGTFLVRTGGSGEAAVLRVPAERVRRILFASRRVTFLSTLEPALVEETGIAGKGLPYRRDRCVTGGPIRLGGRTYRRGLGVASRTILEFALGGGYRAFAAVIGVDESTQGRGAVTFRVIADSKELYRKDMTGADAPERISLPVTGVERLRLEVDFGPDGLDTWDYADWADARVTR